MSAGCLLSLVLWALIAAAFRNELLAIVLLYVLLAIVLIRVLRSEIGGRDAW